MYAHTNDHTLQGVKPYMPAWLFHVTDAPGYFTVDRIDNYEQSDLESSDVMILDDWDTVFIWLGKDASRDEKEQSEKIALVFIIFGINGWAVLLLIHYISYFTLQEYINADPSDRNSEEISLITVKQGRELPYFICHFPTWDKDFWSVSFLRFMYIIVYIFAL